MVLRRILTRRGSLPAQNGVTAQNCEQPIRMPNGLLYPRVEEEQRTHSGDEIAHGYLDCLIVRFVCNQFCFTPALAL